LMINFGDKWIIASVHKNVRRGILTNPGKILDSLKKLGGNAVIQVFDASCVVSVKQIHAAAVAAHLAFKAGSNISHKFEIEFLLRLAADTQIERVLNRIGLKPETSEVGFCVISDDRSGALSGSRSVIELIGGEPMSEEELRSEDRLDRAMEFYGITARELESVQSSSRAEAVLLLILERIATLDLKR